MKRMDIKIKPYPLKENEAVMVFDLLTRIVRKDNIHGMYYED